MKKSAAVLATTTSLLFLAACVEPAGEITDRTKVPSTSHWENKCKTVNGKKTCKAEWDSEPDRCEVRIKIDDGGTMWKTFQCEDWDEYAPGTRYPKDNS